MFKVIKIAVIIIVLSKINFAQELIPADSVSLSDSVFVMQKNPMIAVLKSAILPGWGQISNESYWKAPVIWGVLGYFVYGWITTDNLYSDYKNLYKNSLLSGGSGNAIYKKYRDFYRDNRDLYAFYIGLTYFLNLVDAYVDAHLFDFDTVFDGATNTHQLRVRIKL